MLKHWAHLFLAALLVFGIDQWIKSIVLDGFRQEGECISLVLAYNKGVAFSMFAFLDGWLKYIQLVILSGVLFYIWKNPKYLHLYKIPSGMLIGAGLGNVLDRFIHEGVVDYVYWHCGFDFAIFNFADAMIDVSIVMILWIAYRNREKN